MKFSNKKKYYKFLKDEKSNLVQQFMELEQDMTDKLYSDSVIYGDRNRYKNVLASNTYWPKISTGYINASTILDGNFISTQYPISNTVDHFWTLLYETESNIIVNLTGNNDYLTKSTKYSITNVVYEDDLVCQCSKVTINKPGYKSKTIYYITIKTWPDQSVPSMEDFEKLINIVSILDSGNPLTVHCHAGIGRSGTFILAYYLITKSIYEDPIEILKKMRSTRANMIQTANQFKFVLEFIIAQINKSLRRKLSSSCKSDHFKKLINSDNGNACGNKLSISQDSL
jgi:tyrosine-protein phosphatase non-receptor type 1